MAGRLKGKRLEGWNFSDIPLDNWSIILEYGKRKVEVALEPLVFDNNSTMAYMEYLSMIYSEYT